MEDAFKYNRSISVELLVLNFDPQTNNQSINHSFILFPNLALVFYQLSSLFHHVNVPTFSQMYADTSLIEITSSPTFATNSVSPSYNFPLQKLHLSSFMLVSIISYSHFSENSIPIDCLNTNIFELQ